MNLTELEKIENKVVRSKIFYLLTEMRKMQDRIDTLEKKVRPTSAIGFHAKEGERNIETAFTNVKYNLYD